MTDQPDDATPAQKSATPKSATEVLAELVARRKAAANSGAPGGVGRRQSERAAAARSASKSKPALRKS
jgi:hypothetical protein